MSLLFLIVQLILSYLHPTWIAGVCFGLTFAWFVVPFPSQWRRLK